MQWHGLRKVKNVKDGKTGAREEKRRAECQGAEMQGIREATVEKQRCPDS